MVAGAFLVAMAFTVVPTPLWTLYQRQDGFSTFMVTVAFAAYAVGVVVSLFLAGHVSDRLGRRSVLVPAILVEAVAAGLFLVWNDLAGLVVARLVTGLGVGLITATATAHIVELHAVARPGAGRGRSDVVSTAANMGGFAVGALVSGILAQDVAHPLTTPYQVFGGLLVLAALGVALVPETVVRASEHRPYRPQRLRVPADARSAYLAAGAVAFAAFSVLGMFTSVSPSFLVGTLHETSRAVGGLVVFATFASAAVLQLLVRSLAPRRAVVVGLVALTAGLALVAGAVLATSLGLLVAGGVLAGGAAGVLFRTALATGSSLAEPQYRGEALAGIFLAGYLGLAVPVLGIGTATLTVSLATALVGFAVVTVAVGLLGGRVLLRRG